MHTICRFINFIFGASRMAQATKMDMEKENAKEYFK